MAALSNGHAIDGAVEKIFTIRVTKLPQSLEQEAIQLMFEKYGKVTGIIVLPKKDNTQEAFISYAKYVEAETAINEMNKIPPLMLRVEFKDKDLMAKSHQEEIKIQLDRPFIDYRYQKCHLDDQMQTKKAIDMGKPKCTPSPYQVNNYTPEHELLCPVPTDPSMCNPYEQPGPYKDLNLMYSRGMTEVLKDGRRRISFGRGYTFYDLPEPHHNIGNLVANVCEIRNAGVYEYAPDDLNDESGICKICSSPTAFRCQKCNLAFYCCKPCQVKDWPQHKIDCQSIPNLVKKIPSISLQNGREAPMQNCYEAPQKNDYQARPQSHVDTSQKEPEPQLRRPKPLPQHHQQQQRQERQPSPPSFNRNQQQRQSPPCFNRNQQQQRSPPPVASRQEKSTPRSSMSMNHASSRRSVDESKNEANNQTPVTFKCESRSFSAKQEKPKGVKSVPSDDDIIFTPKNWFISKDKFERVVINTVVEKGEYWVQKVDFCDAVEELFQKLEAYAKTKTLIKPYVNLKCILEHGKMWYRVIVQAVHDDVLKVFFTDFGTYSDVQVTEVVPIDGFENIPSLSRRVRFTENTEPKFMNLKMADTMYVKAVDILDTGAFIVEVMEDKEKGETEALTKEAVPTEAPVKSVLEAPRQPSPRQIALEKLASLPNVLNTLEVGQKGALVMHAQLARDELNGSLVPEGEMAQFESLLENLAEACAAQIAKNPDYVPIMGDFICGEQAPGEWYRGLVISSNPVKLAVVDEARVFTPVRCTPLPKGYHDIVCFGLLVKLTANAELVGKTVDFKVLKISESKDSAIISFVSEDKKCNGEATLTKWTPKPEQKGMQWAKLTSGKDVQIIEAFTQNLIYVHSKEPEEAERRHRLEQEIAKCALNRKPLRDLPVIGQMVMAHYENDGNYYRAFVVRVESKINIQIKYVDYGNEANVKFEQLYDLPDELKEERACAARIKLKGVEEKTPMTDEATSYLTELISHEVALTCTFTGSPFVDGVVLKSPKNEIVNDLLSAYLKPTWQQNNNEEIIDKPIFMINQLPCLKVGDVGDEVKAIALCFYEDPASLMLAPNDEVVITAIQGDMVERIQEYVKNTPTHYIPREKELCIAMYDGIYYRAICMHSSASPTESRVMFIDYGNTECVKHTDIRMMTQDFMCIGPLATLCSISPMIPNEKLTPAIAKRLSELLPVNELITVKIISEDSADGTPYIDIPEIRVKLIEENLL